MPRFMLSASLALFAAALAAAPVVPQADEANARTLALLARGDAVGAEAAARQALEASARFDPEKEIPDAPEKGLLFEDMIAQARGRYRQRRGVTFLSLGRALSLQKRWLEARKALLRAAALMESAEPYLVLASHEDLTPSERIDALLEAHGAKGAPTLRIEQSLMQTGAFPDRNALLALIQHRRLSKELAGVFPDIETRLEPLPDFQTATQRGVFVSSEHLREGAALLIYLPAAGCGRCSEELDAVHKAAAKAGRESKRVVLVMLVAPTELAAARRIARLLALRMDVGRKDRLPAPLLADTGGTLWIVAQRGLLQVRIPLSGSLRSHDVERRLSTVLSFIETPEEETPALPGTDEALGALRRLAAGGRSRQALSEAIDLALRREAGPAPLDELYSLIDRSARSVLDAAGSHEAGGEILEALSRLRGAGAAKAHALEALDEGFGKKLLEAVQSIEPRVKLQAARGQGVYWASPSKPAGSGGGRDIVLQRSFLADQELLHFNFLLRHTSKGLQVIWAGREPGEPRGARAASSGGVFFFEKKDGCRGLRWIQDEGLIYEGCPARVLDDRLVEDVPVLVDPVTGAASPGPIAFRTGRVVQGRWVPAETPLDRGLALFERGEIEAAATAFREAVEQVDPVAPYDEVDLRYNLARCLEAQGKLRRALALFETIGDVAYQDLVDERIRVLSRGGR